VIHKLTDVRLSFPCLWAPRPIAGDPASKPAWSANFLLAGVHQMAPHANDSPAAVALKDIVKAVALAKWGEKQASQILEDLYRKDRVCLHDGGDKEYDGYEGLLFVSARSYIAPLVCARDPFVRDENGKPVIDPATGRTVPAILTEASGVIYGGCYVDASLDVYAQDNQFGRRINATLRGVRFVKDGDAFAAGPAASASEFGDPDLSVEDAASLV